MRAGRGDYFKIAVQQKQLTWLVGKYCFPRPPLHGNLKQVDMLYVSEPLSRPSQARDTLSRKGRGRIPKLFDNRNKTSCLH